MDSHPYAWIEAALETVKRAHWYRSVQTIEGRPGAEVELAGQRVLNFASNDYLGLAGDQRLICAAIQATEQLGTGSTGSRLLTGHRELHRQLERAIAQLKQTEDALVFSSGYLANLGTIAALVGPRDLILSDQYNHSSLKKGASLSGAKVLDYPHLDMGSLAKLLQTHRSNYRRCLILTDTVFSMEGDVCPLPQLLAIATAHNAMVLVDEAHATGVLGATGAGAVEHWGCTNQTLVQVGTLSKALGSLGGYVAGTAVLIDFLRNRCPGWIYTTALSPADTAAALAAIAVVKSEPQRRIQLHENVQRVQVQLQNLPQLQQHQGRFQLLPSQSAILAVQMPDPATALEVGNGIKQAGIFAPVIRPPTVPTSRLRLSLMATHTPEHCQRLVAAIATALARSLS